MVDIKKKKHKTKDITDMLIKCFLCSMVINTREQNTMVSAEVKNYNIATYTVILYHVNNQVVFGCFTFYSSVKYAKALIFLVILGKPL